MATFNKYVRLDKDILLEWVYDDTNLKQETYTVLNNLQIPRKGYISSIVGSFNTFQNTTFEVDSILKKYAKVDTQRFNFLKKQEFTTSPIAYDKIRLHMPTDFTFDRSNIVGSSNYKGLYLQIYTYDTTTKTIIELANLLYDDEDPAYTQYMNINIQTLTYDNKFWGKYIDFEIPSINAIAGQIDVNRKALPNTLNHVLTNGVGVSSISPIFVRFSYISATEIIFGTKYYYLSDIYSVSISQIPEYRNLGVTIQESTQGDFFEIFGTSNGSNESMDNFMSDLINSGKRPQLQYKIYLYEENIISSEQTIIVDSNFSKKILYRPIIQYSNTTAAIDVEMNIIDLVDDSKMTRTSSIGLTNNLFKYGKHLTRIDISGAYKPKIYNRKQQTVDPNGISIAGTGINTVKVNYPMLVDRVKILVGSNSSTDTSYKPMGSLELVMNPFTNLIKFTIASDINTNGSATPYNLGQVLINSTLVLTFRSDAITLEKEIFQETDQNDFNNGIVVFKLEETEYFILKTIAKSNHDFYLTLRAKNNGNNSLLYFGKFILFDEVKFVNFSNSESFGTDKSGKNMTNDGVITYDGGSGNGSGLNSIKNRNALILLDLTANVSVFEDYLKKWSANIYLKEAGGNSSCGAYVYLLLSLSPAFFDDIQKQIGVKKAIPLDFDLGKNVAGDAGGTSLDSLANQIAQFNCAAANRAQ